VNGLVLSFMVTTTAFVLVDSAIARDCGPRAVHSVMTDFGIEVSLQEIKEQLLKDAVWGCSMADIKDCLEDYGLNAYGVSVGEGVALRRSDPVILCMRNYRGSPHFVVARPSSMSLATLEVQLAPNHVVTRPLDSVLPACFSEVLIISDKPNLPIEAYIHTEHFPNKSPFWTLSFVVVLVVLTTLVSRLPSKGKKSNEDRTDYPLGCDCGSGKHRIARSPATAASQVRG